jgi:hypothetical protein
MDATALHLEIRNALSLSDELGRHEHALGNDSLAWHLAAVRTALSDLERDLGRSHERAWQATPIQIEKLERVLAVLQDRSEEIPATLRPRVGQLLAALERVVYAEQRPLSAVPAKPLFGVLPLKRVIPQDVHSVMDYLSAGAYLASSKLARTARGRAVGVFLGGNVGAVSLMTDYRLSATKLIPIELHELLDHASGGTAVMAPFVLGYVRKDPIAAAIQIMTGLGTIVASLFTDYRAERGVSRALRSRGGPEARAARRTKVVRVPEAQRPLEGLASPSYLPPMNV